MDLEKIVAELERERDRLSQAIALLKERNFPANAQKTAAVDGRRLRQDDGAAVSQRPAESDCRSS